MLLRRLSALAVLTIALGGAGAAYAAVPDSPNAIVAQRQGGREGRGRRGGGELRGIERLNLSSEQREEIEAIRNQYQEETQDLRQEMRDAKQQLQQLMSSNASDGELRSQHNRVIDLHQEMAQTRFEQMLEIRSVLTPEQREQWAEQMQQRRQGGRRNRRRNGRGDNGDNGN
ncbi:MAG: Spy/CpxP family protein refolding chaperone [Oscillatoria sp. SIO1A7]|nr:Spy/CpxP family protein refolding chaperone [Oscillatoria sp. SIO1A7]